MVVHILTENASSKCFFFSRLVRKCHSPGITTELLVAINTPFSVQKPQNMEFNEIEIAKYHHHFQSSLSGAQRWIRPTAHQIKNCLSNGLTELNLA